ncbi:unnamed protein product [Oreochromis niloticus]|nr:unnamed protein product [Mustela putorius furo]
MFTITPTTHQVDSSSPIQSLESIDTNFNMTSPLTYTSDMVKICNTIMRLTWDTTENADLASTQTELCLESVGADFPEKTDDTGAKDSILNESSVDVDHSDNEKIETPGLEAQPGIECMSLDTSSFWDQIESVELEDEATPIFQGFLPDIECLSLSEISPLSESLSGEKLCVNNIIQCKEKDLIFSLREQLDSITVPVFTKHLLALPKRVLSVSKYRDEYREVVENFTKDLVIHAMGEVNETTSWYSATFDFIIQRLSQKIWNQILSSNFEISLENIEELSLTVYNELHKRWPYPGQFMKTSNPMIDEVIFQTFKKHAIVKRRSIISWASACDFVAKLLN